MFRLWQMTLHLSAGNTRPSFVVFQLLQRWCQPHRHQMFMSTHHAIHPFSLQTRRAPHSTLRASSPRLLQKEIIVKLQSSRNNSRFFLLSLVMALLLLPTAQTSVLAHKGAQGIVKQRMTIMAGMKDHMKVIAQTVKGQQAFEEKPLTDALDFLKEHAGDRLAKLFPKGSSGAKSDADPAIWTDWETFQALALSLTKASDDFRLALDKKPCGKPDKTALTQLETKYDALKQVCKDCHERFRL